MRRRMDVRSRRDEAKLDPSFLSRLSRLSIDAMGQAGRQVALRSKRMCVDDADIIKDKELEAVEGERGTRAKGGGCVREGSLFLENGSGALGCFLNRAPVIFPAIDCAAGQNHASVSP